MNADTTKILNFILHWTGAGFWAGLGYVLFTHFLLPHVPGL